jgi:hypothetical protein
MPLSKIASIARLPMGDRSITDTERLADLRDARSRITGSDHGCR